MIGQVLLVLLAVVGFVALFGLGCIFVLLWVDELHLTRSSQARDPRPLHNSDDYLITSERLRVLEREALDRLADVKRRAEAEHDGRAR